MLYVMSMCYFVGSWLLPILPRSQPIAAPHLQPLLRILRRLQLDGQQFVSALRDKIQAGNEIMNLAHLSFCLAIFLWQIALRFDCVKGWSWRYGAGICLGAGVVSVQVHRLEIAFSFSKSAQFNTSGFQISRQLKSVYLLLR